MDRAEQVSRVLELMAEGQSESSACREVGIPRTTFRFACLKEAGAERYAQAMERLAESQVELLEKAIDDMRTGVIDAQQARVEIDARKWFASKFLPKRYGEKVQVEANVTTRSAQELSDDELARIAAGRGS